MSTTGRMPTHNGSFVAAVPGTGLADRAASAWDKAPGLADLGVAGDNGDVPDAHLRVG
jgi:hypothetical protein